MYFMWPKSRDFKTKSLNLRQNIMDQITNSNLLGNIRTIIIYFIAGIVLTANREI